MRRHLESQLAGVLCLALLLRVAAYALFAGLLHPDEIFQYAEQAHRLVFGQGIVPWEYRAGLRSWLFPGILAAIMQAARVIGDGPVVQNAAVAIFLAVLSLPSVACCMAWGRQAAGVAGGVAAGVLAACWSEMVLMAVHPLLDGVGTDFLIPGVFLLQRATTAAGRINMLFASGTLLGLALTFRLQLAPAIIWSLVRLCGAKPASRGVPAVCGLALPVLASGVLDWLTLGSPFQSVFRYAGLNLHGVADFYGTEPWYTYLLLLPLGAGWLFPLMATCIGYGVQRLSLLAELAGIILATFTLVSHKEARFLFPMFPLLVTLAGVGSARLAQRLAWPHAAATLGIGWIALCALNAPFAGSVSLWARGQGMLTEMRRASADPQACGLAIVPPSLWFLTGGYTNLRPGLALLALTPPDTPAKLTGFDYALAFDNIDLSRNGLTKLDCSDTGMWEQPGRKICLWHNPGHCAGPLLPALDAPDSPLAKG
jgi:phosphatidylinositol glycan class B